MSFPTTFATLTAGNQPAALLDTMFGVVGSMGQIQCTSTGTNTIALTPITNMPAVTGYANYQLFGFVVAATTTGSATINVSAVGAKNAYLADGITAIGSGDLVIGGYAIFAYNSALNSAAGGFQIVSPRGASAYPGLPCVAAGGSADAITATYSPAITLTDLTLVAFTATAANATTTPTFAPNSLAAHTITKKGGQALAAGDIPGAGAVCILEYNLANTRWELANPAPSSSGGSSKVIPYTVVTDTTDIVLAAVPTQTNVGSTLSVAIPTKGIIYITASCETITATARADVVFGLRIGSTNYWPNSSVAGTTMYNLGEVTSGVTGTYVASSSGILASAAGSATTTNSGSSQTIGIMIEASGIVTGTQTVQVIAGFVTSTTGTATLKGTVVTTRAYITVEDHT